MQRYFSLSNSDLLISNDDIHHISNVMRSKIGDCFELVQNGKVLIARITNLKPFNFEIDNISEENNELNNHLTLFYALSKGDKNDLVIQKATELGVHKIVLISSSRCVVKMNNEDFNKKKTRFERIIKEAAEQSKRNIIPEIVGIYNINNIPNELLCDHNFVAYECDKGCTKFTLEYYQKIANGESVSLLIGSEGGLTEEEVNNLLLKSFKKISLGKRILRTETAAINAISGLTLVLEAK